MTAHPSPLLAPDRPRFPLVDALRGFSAFSVLLYHVAVQFPIGPNSVWGWVAGFNAGQPATCVVLFFLISGFVLYRPFVAARYAGRPFPGLEAFAVRRVARIVPGYWLALAICTLWVPLPEVKTLHGIARYFLFLQVYGPEPQAVMGLGQAWTLCVEVPFYVALPGIAGVVRWAGARISLLASEVGLCVVLMAGASVYQYAVLKSTFTPDPFQKIEELQMWLPGGIGMFAAGMLLAVLSVEIAHRASVPRWVAIVDAAPWLPFLMGIGAWFAIPLAAKLQGLEGFGGYIPAEWVKMLCCGLLMVPAIFGTPGRGWLRRLLGLRPLVWLGTVCFGFYLWHAPLLIIFRGDLVPHGRVFTLVVLTAASTVFGAASWYLLERPAMRLGNRYIRARSKARVRPDGPIVAAVAGRPRDPA